MLNAYRSLLILAAAAAAVPCISHEEILACHRRCCCPTCQQPCGRCCCPAPAVPPAGPAFPQTGYQPVLQTQYAQQQVIQQRDVAVTEYRAEPVVETIPVTSYENVVVDEGSYQTVWVPRLTTKTVARTGFQTRTAYRTTPYQVTRRISEYATQTLPYQTVRYVPTGTSLAYTTAPTYIASGIVPTYTAPAIVSAPIVSAPVIASRPTDTTSGLVPDARYADTPVTPITPRSSAAYSGGSGSRSALRFVPAPSAATVWRSRATATR